MGVFGPDQGFESESSITENLPSARDVSDRMV